MAGNKHGAPDLHTGDNPKVRHEPSDVNVRAITRFGVAFVLVGIAICFLIWFVFDVFRRREQASKTPLPAQRPLNVDARQLPPEPRLQPSPITDLNRMLAAEEEILNGYAWIDRQRGLVRIPIARAMDLVVREGLPVRADGPPAPASTATVPKESGLGPIVHQAGGPLSPNRQFPPDQPLEIRGNGSPRDGRAAAGPPTPPERSLADTGPAPAAETPAPGGHEQKK
jgi:hypothetical protein